MSQDVAQVWVLARHLTDAPGTARLDAPPPAFWHARILALAAPSPPPHSLYPVDKLLHLRLYTAMPAASMALPADQVAFRPACFLPVFVFCWFASRLSCVCSSLFLAHEVGGGTHASHPVAFLGGVGASLCS